MTAPTLLDVLAAEVAKLDNDQLDRLAERLAPLLDRVATHRTQTDPALPMTPAWLNARQAAAYLGLTVHALHKHTAARTIPFEQDTPGGKTWFRADELDAWRRGRPGASKTLAATTASKTLPNNRYRGTGPSTRANKNPA